MKNLLFAIIGILLLASCTGRRYGNLSYVKKSPAKQENAAREKPVKSKPGITVLRNRPALPAINAGTNEVCNTRPEMSRIKHKAGGHIPQNEVKAKESTAHLYENTPVQQVDEVPQKKVPNTMATASLILAIGGLVLTVIALVVPLLVGLLYLVALIQLAAFIVAILALDQMNGKPNTYNNKFAAIIALVISGLYGLILLLFIALALLFIL